MRSLRILFIAPYVPSLTRVRPFNLIKQLAARGHRVTLCAVSAEGASGADAVRPFCETVEVVPVSRAQSWWNCVRALPGALPLQAMYGYSPRLQARVHALLERTGDERFDLVHIEHLRAALFGWSLTRPRVFDAVDCISQLFAQTATMGAGRASRWMAGLDLPRTRAFERRLVGHFPRTLATSGDERAALAGLAADAREQARHAERIAVLPNGVDLEYFRPSEQPRDAATLVFVGRMSYHANISAVDYLIRDVLPLVWRARPDVRLTVVGENPPAALRRLASGSAGRISVTGTVADVRPHVTQATIAVCPVTYAVGIQNKILEAMAMATPAVCTPAATGGLRAMEGQDLLVGGEAAAVAKHIVALLDDPAYRARIGAAGRRYVEREHDWRVSGERLEAIYFEEIERQKQKQKQR